jgi:hypothetical protein
MRTTIIGAAVLTALSGAGALAQSYDDLARQPSAYVGTVVNFKGKVVQALESGNKYLLRVDVTKKPYNIWSERFWFSFAPPHQGSGCWKAISSISVADLPESRPIQRYLDRRFNYLPWLLAKLAIPLAHS